MWKISCKLINVISASHSHSESVDSSSTLTNEEENSYTDLSPDRLAHLKLLRKGAVAGVPPDKLEESLAGVEPTPSTSAPQPPTELEIQKSQGAIPKRRLPSASPDTDERSSTQGT